MINIDLPTADHRFYDLADFSEKVIEESEIILCVYKLKVKYYKQNGFRIMDLFNMTYHQNLREHYCSMTESYPEDVIDEEILNNALLTSDYDEYMDGADICLHGWTYDKGTKMVKCNYST